MGAVEGAFGAPAVSEQGGGCAEPGMGQGPAQRVLAGCMEGADFFGGGHGVGAAPGGQRVVHLAVPGVEECVGVSGKCGEPCCSVDVLGG
ncbi:hypothetical protein [Streptomyces telluris]|uniref:Uncharacterized protein n=1 Tax=Streptomyces telluris TaxID=2720021 RepID=A0A9X2RMQ0_9ACTN|nr:hypothetical protein [Streptomyces telluris]MCQ8772108.1 hypothetical protein [Streptomyces telluris]NJP80161.1 hypothetical protein [Streptomyces telluris]